MTNRFRFESRPARMARLLLAPVLAGSLIAAFPGVAVAASDRDAERAERALADGKAGKAVAYAERAVAETPRDANLRALLGQAYLKDGRMIAAREAFADANELGDASARTALMRALAQIGSHDLRGAVATIEYHGRAIPAADRGLALALAGQAGRGSEIIAQAIRSGDNTVKTRQNLAYAYALDGRWSEARLMAAQDVPGDQLQERIAEWASTAAPDFVAVRVARLLNVEISAEDGGMPAALALANFPDAPALAEADAPFEEDVAPVEEEETSFAVVEAVEEEAVASDEAEPVVLAEAPVAEPQAAPVEAGADASKPRFVALAVVQDVTVKADPAPTAKPEAAKPAPVKTAAAKPAKQAVAAALPTPGNGTHVAQLGSFTSEADAMRGWTVFQSRYANLAGAKPVITRATVNGTEYFRVAAGGFDAKGARQMCSAVKAGGNGCLAIARPVTNATGQVVRVAKVD